jgi:hypothetical protein
MHMQFDYVPVYTFIMTKLAPAPILGSTSVHMHGTFTHMLALDLRMQLAYVHGAL